MMSSLKPTESKTVEEIPATAVTPLVSAPVPVVASAPEYEDIARPCSIHVTEEVETVKPEEVNPQQFTPATSQPVSQDIEESDDNHSDIVQYEDVKAEIAPLRTILRQIVKDEETADRYTKYVDRKNKENIEKGEKVYQHCKMEEPILYYGKLTNKAVPPKHATPRSIGADLFTPEDVCILAEGQILIPTDLLLATSPGYYLRIASKSGLALKQGLVVEGGVVDPDYRGNISIILRNTTKTDCSIKGKEPVPQVIRERAAIPEIVETKISRDTSRGAGGFGSVTK